MTEGEFIARSFIGTRDVWGLQKVKRTNFNYVLLVENGVDLILWLQALAVGFGEGADSAVSWVV